MADLRALVEEVGAEEVTTYVQSGNVVFKSREGAPALTRRIEEELERRLGLDVRVLVRTAAELRTVAAANPFARDDVDAKKLHVTFLAAKPAQARVRKLDPARAAPDEFRVAAREVYLHCPNGYGRSKLTNAYFEQQLDLAATTRNWKTVTTLADLA